MIERRSGSTGQLDYSTIDVQVTANLLKKFFRDLPDPILESELMEQWLFIASINEGGYSNCDGGGDGRYLL